MAPFGNGDLEFRLAVPERSRLDRTRRYEPVLELDTSTRGNDRGAHIATNRGDVRPLDLRTRMSEDVRGLAVRRGPCAGRAVDRPDGLDEGR